MEYFNLKNDIYSHVCISSGDFLVLAIYKNNYKDREKNRLSFPKTVSPLSDAIRGHSTEAIGSIQQTQIPNRKRTQLASKQLLPQTIEKQLNEFRS